MSNESTISTQEAIRWITAVKRNYEQMGHMPEVVEATNVGIMTLKDEHIIGNKIEAKRWLTAVKRNYVQMGHMPEVVEALNLAIVKLQ